MEVDLGYAALSATRFMEGWEIDRTAQTVEIMKQGHSINIVDEDNVPRQLRMIMESAEPDYDEQID